MTDINLSNADIAIIAAHKAFAYREVPNIVGNPEKLRGNNALGNPYSSAGLSDVDLREAGLYRPKNVPDIVQIRNQNPAIEVSSLNKLAMVAEKHGLAEVAESFSKIRETDLRYADVRENVDNLVNAFSKAVGEDGVLSGAEQRSLKANATSLIASIEAHEPKFKDRSSANISSGEKPISSADRSAIVEIGDVFATNKADAENLKELSGILAKNGLKDVAAQISTVSQNDLRYTSTQDAIKDFSELLSSVVKDGSLSASDVERVGAAAKRVEAEANSR